MLSVDRVDLPLSHLGFVEAGAAVIHLVAGPNGARALLIGGAPFGEEIVMWWNFIGRSHDEIVQFRNDWQTDVIAGATTNGRFGIVNGYDGDAIPAPELPNVRLKTRQ